MKHAFDAQLAKEIQRTAKTCIAAGCRIAKRAPQPEDNRPIWVNASIGATMLELAADSIRINEQYISKPQAGTHKRLQERLERMLGSIERVQK